MLTLVNHFQVKEILKVFVQIVNENISKKVINIVQIYDDNGETATFGDLKTCTDELSQITVKYTNVYRGNATSDAVKEADLVLIHHLSTDENVSIFLSY